MKVGVVDRTEGVGVFMGETQGRLFGLSTTSVRHVGNSPPPQTLAHCDFRLEASW